MENNQINITDSAVRKILSLTANEDDGVKLRLSVSGGGCSGFQYGFSLDSETTPDDIIFSKDGADLIVDQISLEYLNGSEIDFENKLIESSFKINNPNAAASCGCGTSFSPKAWSVREEMRERVRATFGIRFETFVTGGLSLFYCCCNRRTVKKISCQNPQERKRRLFRRSIGRRWEGTLWLLRPGGPQNAQ